MFLRYIRDSGSDPKTKQNKKNEHTDTQKIQVGKVLRKDASVYISELSNVFLSPSLLSPKLLVDGQTKVNCSLKGGKLNRVGKEHKVIYGVPDLKVPMRQVVPQIGKMRKHLHDNIHTHRK